MSAPDEYKRKTSDELLSEARSLESQAQRHIGTGFAVGKGKAKRAEAEKLRKAAYDKKRKKPAENQK
jgi:hypothetical protein